MNIKKGGIGMDWFRGSKKKKSDDYEKEYLARYKKGQKSRPKKKTPKYKKSVETESHETNQKNEVETRKEDGAIVSVTVWRSHEALIGADGIAFDKAGNLWIATNRRNAIMAITPEGEGGRRIIEVAKNDNMGPLEFPSSVAFAGESLYITNFDVGGMGDNEDNSLGIGPSIVRIQLGVEGLPSPP